MKDQIYSIDTMKWLNKPLGYYVRRMPDGKWHLYNQFGYAGAFATLGAALRADQQMNREPFQS